MIVERLEVLGIDVKNLDEAIKKFSDILGTTFVKAEGVRIDKTMTEHADQSFEEIPTRMAMDRTGFVELIESKPPVEKDWVRSIHLKVPDIEQAKAEMKRKGIRLLADLKMGDLKEAIFSPDDFAGIRLCLVEYEQPTLIDAILQS